MSPFVEDTISRALNTICQTLLGYLTVGTAITTIAWVPALSVAATAGLISVLQSIMRRTGEGITTDGSEDA